MKIHPNESALQDLFRQQDGGTLRMLEHVLGCPACRERAQGVLASWRQSEPGKLLRLPAEVPDYDRALENATRDSLARTICIERERSEARTLFPALEACPPERRKLLLCNSARYRTWGMLELLLERSRTADFHDSEQIEHFAELALVLADQLPPESYGAPSLEDMRARAWSYIGNARRLQFDPQGAEEAFETASYHLRQGTGEPVERALLLSFKASLCRAQGQKSQAIQLIHRAIDIFRTAGELHKAGKCLVQLAGVHLNSGTPEEALPLLYEALELLGDSAEPQLSFFAWNNLISGLTCTGRYLEAQSVLRRTKDIYDRESLPWAGVRLRWMEGKIALGLGQAQQAESALLEARDGFLAVGAVYEAAQVILVLAALYHKEGRAAAIRPLAEEISVFVNRPGKAREAQEALALLTAAEGGIA
jgi:tetratricopeptide (TPR) repeat protein